MVNKIWPPSSAGDDDVTSLDTQRVQGFFKTQVELWHQFSSLQL